jgi:hypothetical protein
MGSGFAIAPFGDLPLHDIYQSAQSFIGGEACLMQSVQFLISRKPCLA